MESTTVFYAGDAELAVERYNDGESRALEIAGGNGYADVEFGFEREGSDQWGLGAVFENDNDESATYEIYRDGNDFGGEFEVESPYTQNRRVQFNAGVESAFIDVYEDNELVRSQ